MISNLSSKESGCGCGGGGTASAAPCSCGGAGCGSCVAQGIVRPRFFAGQLLTEDDLQLLSDYVGQKNRLHNRHLFGAGVVCGLEVTCDPCGDGRVIVQPGYAIDCCGNDLTLSCPQVVDLNALVRKLRKNDCVDPCPDIKKLKGRTEEEDDDDDDDTDKEKPNFRYCLYIRYCEQPSDPVTPYSTGEECVQVGCEPTRIREGVTFELRCVDPHMAGSPLIERLCLSLGDLDKFVTVFEAFQTLGKGAKILVFENKRATLRRKVLRGEIEFVGGSEIGRVDDRSRVVGLTNRMLRDTKEAFKIVRNWLIERLSKSNFITDCTLKQRVYDLVLPASEAPDDVDVPAAANSSKELVDMFIDYLRTSVCRVLNPACLPCEDSAVLLACLDWEECEVKRICNMERTYVLSPAAVRYWLPPLQLAGNLVERLCCVAWEDLGQESSPPHERDVRQILKEELKNELKRLIKASFCGVSDRTFDHTLDRLGQLFRNGSHDTQSFDRRNDLIEPDARPTPQTTTTAQPVTESAAAGVTSTPAAPARRARPRKTGMKAAKKGATKTASKASVTATETSNTTAPATATDTATTGGPAATGTTTSEPAPTATTTKGEGK
jgi:hypothetical protein